MVSNKSHNHRMNPVCKRMSRSRKGFTLIELMVAMGILVIIVLMMARVYTDTTEMFQMGTKRVVTATEGRVIMDFLVREMSMAIADEMIAFKLNSDQDIFYVPPGYTADSWRTYGAQSDEVCFVAMVRSGGSYFRRTANQFVYFVAPMTRSYLDSGGNLVVEEMENRYRLVRTRRTQTVFNTADNRAQGPYGRPPNPTGNHLWWQYMEPDWLDTRNPALRDLETIAENVAAFEVWAWVYDRDRNEHRAIWSFDSTDIRYNDGRIHHEQNVVPLWVDIYIELLGEEEAERAAVLWELDRDEARRYVDNNVRRFNARVFFPNRERALAFRE